MAPKGSVNILYLKTHGVSFHHCHDLHEEHSSIKIPDHVKDVALLLTSFQGLLRGDKETRDAHAEYYANDAEDIRLKFGEDSTEHKEHANYKPGEDGFHPKKTITRLGDLLYGLDKSDIQHARSVAQDFRQCRLDAEAEIEWVHLLQQEIFTNDIHKPGNKGCASAISLCSMKRELDWTAANLFPPYQQPQILPALPRLSKPRPDFTFAYKMSDLEGETKQNDSTPSSHLDPYDPKYAFSFRLLDHLQNHAKDEGFVASPRLSRRRQESKRYIAATSLLCFPWAVVESKKDEEKKDEDGQDDIEEDKSEDDENGECEIEEDDDDGRETPCCGKDSVLEWKCKAQAANAALVALKMRTGLMRKENRWENETIPPFIAITTIGPVVKLWLAYVDGPEDDESSKIRFVCVWKTSLLYTWGVITLLHVVKQMREWAAIRRTQIEHHIRAWIKKYPNRTVPSPLTPKPKESIKRTPRGGASKSPATLQSSLGHPKNGKLAPIPFKIPFTARRKPSCSTSCVSVSDQESEGVTDNESPSPVLRVVESDTSLPIDKMQELHLGESTETSKESGSVIIIQELPSHHTELDPDSKSSEAPPQPKNASAEDAEPLLPGQYRAYSAKDIPAGPIFDSLYTDSGVEQTAVYNFDLNFDFNFGSDDSRLWPRKPPFSFERWIL